DYTHADLGGCFGGNCKVAGGYDFVNKDNDPKDDNGHGTHVAATAAGNGVLKGVAPDATIYAYKVLNAEGSGTWVNVIAAIERSVDLNQNRIPCEKNDYLDVISLSLGGAGDPDDPQSRAIDNAALCTIAVVAAGNSGPYVRTIGSPGTARKAITVGASYKTNYQQFEWSCTSGTETSCGRCPSTGKILCDYWGDGNPVTDQITSFSSRGPIKGIDRNQKPDLVAPGAIICSSRFDNIFPDGSNPYYKICLDNKHVQLAGTSMATPMVAGAAALLKQKHPDWKPGEIKTILKNTAIKLIDPKTKKEYSIDAQGSGKINIQSAITRNNPAIAEIKISYFIEGKRDIKGTAKGENFKEYKLFFAKSENPSIWNELITNNKQIDNGILFTFDPSSLDDGTYFLKLEVFNNQGEKFEDKNQFYYSKTNPNIQKIGKYRTPTQGGTSHGAEIDKDKIVWSEKKGSLKIYDFTTKKSTEIYYDSLIEPRYPDIFGNKIAYTKYGDTID
ncbi:MAG: S8 family serine peptidase, partial [Nanoarchaeota archaeon]